MSEDASYPKLPIEPYVPKTGYLFYEEKPETVLCQPVLIPLKSVSLQKLENMLKQTAKHAEEQSSQT